MITLSLIPRGTPASALAADTGAAHGGTALNVQPATAGAVAPTATAVHFPQASRPAIDLASVRGALRTVIETTVVDLSAAHSIAAGTALLLPIQGTAYYIDKGSDVGFALIHIQDQTFTPVNSINVFPGDANSNLPFTFWMLENAAQPGKVLRIHYGTDIVFNPGPNSPPSASELFVSANQAFIAGFAQGGVAGNRTYTKISNFGPAVKRLYMDAVWFQDASAVTDIQSMYDVAGSPGPNGVSRMPVGANSVARLQTNNFAADPGSVFSSYLFGQVQANTYIRFPMSPPIVLNPGDAWHLRTNTLAVAISGGFEWREV